MPQFRSRQTKPAGPRHNYQEPLENLVEDYCTGWHNVFLLCTVGVPLTATLGHTSVVQVKVLDAPETLTCAGRSCLNYRNGRNVETVGEILTRSSEDISNAHKLLSNLQMTLPNTD